jgi:hypothetical protein
VIPGVESVIADLILERIADKESVIVILEEAFGADLDIFAEGSRSDRIRFDGTDYQFSPMGIGKGLTDTNFGEGEDISILPIESFKEVPR